MHRKIRISRYDLNFELYKKNTKKDIVLGEDEKQSIINLSFRSFIHNPFNLPLYYKQLLENV